MSFHTYSSRTPFVADLFVTSVQHLVGWERGNTMLVAFELVVMAVTQCCLSWHSLSISHSYLFVPPGPRMIGLHKSRLADPRILAVANSVFYLASEIHIVRAGISLSGLVCALDVLHHASVDNQVDCPDPAWPLRRHREQDQSRNTAAA